jgi:predicted nuclease of predicted toxin-antitoxin system
MLKFILDVGVGKIVHSFLIQEGYDAISVTDLDPRMKDIDILNLAVQEERLVITMDKDFGELVYHSGRPHQGVLLLRLEDATGEEKYTVVKAILKDYESELESNFAVYMNGRLRVKNRQ